MATNLIKRTRPKRLFYAKDVNMSLSFDSLYELAKKQLGAEPEVGDLIICDNHRQDKRKVFQIVKGGHMIHYGRINKDEGTFTPLADHNGQLKNLTKAIL